MKSVTKGFDGDIFIAGQRNWGEGTITRLDSLGNLIWSKNFTVMQQINFNHVVTSADSNLVAVGKVYEPSSGEIHGYCVKINQQGDTLWSRSFSFVATNSCSVSRVLSNPDSSIVISGKIGSDGSLFAAKISHDGTMLWSNVYTMPIVPVQNITSLQRFDDGTYLIGGYTNDGGSNFGFLQHISQSGQLDWSKQFNDIHLQDVIVTSSGIVGLYYDYQSYMAGLFKLDLAGNLVWAKNYSEMNAMILEADTQHLTYLSDSCFALAIGDQMSGTAVVKFDSNGVILHHRKLMLGSTNILEAQNKGLFVIGIGPMWGLKSTLTSEHFGLIKTDSLLNIYTSTIDGSCDYGSINPQVFASTLTTSPINLTSIGTLTERTQSVSVNFYTFQSYIGCVDFLGGLDEQAFANELNVYPNASSGIFHFEQESAQKIQITLYSPSGQAIQTVTSTSLSTEIDLSGVSQGIYFYRVVREDHQKAEGKLVVLN